MFRVTGNYSKFEVCRVVRYLQAEGVKFIKGLFLWPECFQPEKKGMCGATNFKMAKRQ
jgi:hypothetical protein